MLVTLTGRKLWLHSAETQVGMDTPATTNHTGGEAESGGESLVGSLGV